jgi:hypothetical protein
MLQISRFKIFVKLQESVLTIAQKTPRPDGNTAYARLSFPTADLGAAKTSVSAHGDIHLLYHRVAAFEASRTSRCYLEISHL